jgi:hypothetical protein
MRFGHYSVDLRPLCPWARAGVRLSVASCRSWTPCRSALQVCAAPSNLPRSAVAFVSRTAISARRMQPGPGPLQRSAAAPDHADPQVIGTIFNHGCRRDRGLLPAVPLVEAPRITLVATAGNGESGAFRVAADPSPYGFRSRLCGVWRRIRNNCSGLALVGRRHSAYRHGPGRCCADAGRDKHHRLGWLEALTAASRIVWRAAAQRRSKPNPSPRSGTRFASIADVPCYLIDRG